MAGLPPFISLPGVPGIGGLGLPKLGGTPAQGPDFGSLYDQLKAQQAPQSSQDQGIPAIQAPAKSLQSPEGFSLKAIQPTERSAGIVGELGKPLASFLDSVNNLQLNADAMKKDLATGGDVEVHDVMIAEEKANLGVELTMQIRNKLVDAYQEVMRMSV